MFNLILSFRETCVCKCDILCLIQTTKSLRPKQRDANAKFAFDGLDSQFVASISLFAKDKRHVERVNELLLDNSQVSANCWKLNPITALTTQIDCSKKAKANEFCTLRNAVDN